MLRRFSVNLAIYIMLMDATLVVLALALAVRIRPLFNPLESVQELPAQINMPALVYVLAVLIWLSVLFMLSIYDGRRNLFIVNELTNLTIGVLIAFVSLAGVLYLSYREVSRLLYFLFGIQVYLYLMLWRILLRVFFHWRGETGIAIRRVLIIGAGDLGQEVSQQFTKYQFGLKLVGFLDDDHQIPPEDLKTLGAINRARELVISKKIDDVILTLPRKDHQRVNQLVAELHDLPIKVWVVPDYFSLSLHRAKIDEIAGIPMLDLRAPALNDYQLFTKRVFDIVVTSLLLVPTLVLMGIVSIAVWLDDPGPIFFRQTRIGENGRLFKMYKFRTMVVGAEDMLHLVEVKDDQGREIHKIPDDPRVTRIGKILRQTSLDELPQLLNVIEGKMSLVGPRPELPHLVAKYQRWQRKRFAVPQGITGWWQVNGRSDKPMHLNTEDDLYYLQNYSLFLDIKILIQTIWVVLRGRGAF
jgi:exopolysaccharide biosynthesis polyprenyl glycosylphosphotransferase